MALPQDPVILLSYINTQLRDYYSSLSKLCENMEIDEEELRNKLKTIDYEYIPEINQFK